MGTTTINGAVKITGATSDGNVAKLCYANTYVDNLAGSPLLDEIYNGVYSILIADGDGDRNQYVINTNNNTISFVDVSHVDEGNIYKITYVLRDGRWEYDYDEPLPIGTHAYFHSVVTGEDELRFSCILPFENPLSSLSGNSMLNIFEYIVGREGSGNLVYFMSVSNYTKLHCYDFSGSSVFSNAAFAAMTDTVRRIV